MRELFPMPVITEKARQKLVGVLKNRLKMYHAIQENQHVSSVRPRGGLEPHVEESILMTEITLAALTVASPLNDDVEAILGLLEGNEWAEHCTKTPLGNRLESAITEMIESQTTSLTHRAEAAERLAEFRGEQLVAKSHIQPLPDHEIRETVNQLCGIAKAYGQTQQLRERIAHYIVERLKCAPVCKLPTINPQLLAYCDLVLEPASKGFYDGMMELMAKHIVATEKAKADLAGRRSAGASQ